MTRPSFPNNYKFVDSNGNLTSQWAYFLRSLASQLPDPSKNAIQTTTGTITIGDLTPLLDSVYVNVTGDSMSGNLSVPSLTVGGNTLWTFPVDPYLGGTGLTSIGFPNQVLGVDPTGSNLEYKNILSGSGIVVTPYSGNIGISNSGVTSLIAGSGISLSGSTGNITITSTGGGTGTVTSVAVTGSTGLSVSGSPITSSGTITLTLGTELQGLSGLAANGMIARTGAGTYSPRTIAGTASNIVVSNGDGVAGAPTINLATAGTSVSNLFQKITTDTFGRVTATTAVSASDITTALTFTPINKAGDTMSGGLSVPSITIAGTSISSFPLLTSIGGTGLSSIGTANQVLGVNTGGTANEYKTISGSTGLSVSPSAGNIVLANTGVTSLIAGSNISLSGSTGAVTISSTSSGSVSGSGQISLFLGSFPGGNEAQVTVTGLTGISSTATCFAKINGDDVSSSYTSSDHRYLAGFLNLSCSVPTAGSGFVIYSTSLEKLSGYVTVRYFWQN
jgi:hypothetical protein